MNMKKIITVLAGNTLYALAVSLFILPNGLITGGTTGLALVAQYKLGIPIAAFVGVFNVVMFVAGAAVLGKAFAFTTIISTFYYPLYSASLKDCSVPLPSPGIRCWRPFLPDS